MTPVGDDKNNPHLSSSVSGVEERELKTSSIAKSEQTDIARSQDEGEGWWVFGDAGCVY